MNTNSQDAAPLNIHGLISRQEAAGSVFVYIKLGFKMNRLSATQPIKYLQDDLMLCGKPNRRTVKWDGHTHSTACAFDATK